MKPDYISADGRIKLYNADCMDFLAQCEPNQFDLAVVDPPYGMENKKGQATSRIKKYGQLVSVNDAKPSMDFFKNLFVFSAHQIIWGYNHLSDMLPSCREFIFGIKTQYPHIQMVNWPGLLFKNCEVL